MSEIELLELIADNQNTLLDMLDSHLVNIESGLQIILYIGVAFLVWKVIQILYKLFGGVFFGGI